MRCVAPSARIVTLRQPLHASPLLTSSHSAVAMKVYMSCAAFAAPAVPQLRGVGSPTPIARFDMKKYQMEKRKRREMEKAGIDENDDEPWIAPEEQHRMDEEEERRRAEEAERVKEMLERRAQEDLEKRKKFKEFRALQVAMSRTRKEANEARKLEQQQKTNTPLGHRVLEEKVDDSEEADDANSQKQN